MTEIKNTQDGQEIDVTISESNEAPIIEPKLYAGKYKSVEELEKAYKNSAKVFNENKALQDKLKSLEAPESYNLPESISLPTQEIQGLQNIAKTAGLNQEQFNKTLSAMTEQQQYYQSQLEERKKTLGYKLAIVEDYVTKTYPSSLQTTILNTLIGDENAMSDALKHRDQLLNSQVPGLSNQRANLPDPYEGKNELLKVAKEYERDPSDKNRKRYINLASEVAEARFKK
ncbi:MAG: hypothetical protein REH83_04430 [Rickettsiella sp.]|nr:hypothetical protein [Rickettsiella sp.]